MYLFVIFAKFTTFNLFGASMYKIFSVLGSVYCGLSVLLGAFGAHALKNKLTPYYLDIFETGVKYQMYHGLSLILTSIMIAQFKISALKYAALGFSVGTLIFSGSLYLLVFLNMKIFGAITPIGGSILICSWLCLAWACYQQ